MSATTPARRIPKPGKGNITRSHAYFWLLIGSVVFILAWLAWNLWLV